MARLHACVTFVAAGCFVAPVDGATFTLLVGVDARRAPGPARSVTPVPGPGFANQLIDADRLAGAPPSGAILAFDGNGAPLFQPNAFGSLSFTFRRGSIPIGSNQVPELAVDFLGGPLLDLDGNIANATRSLVPVFGVQPVVIPGSASRVELSFDFIDGVVLLHTLDATGINVGAPGIAAEIATTINVLAGTTVQGSPGSAINPSVDTRIGTLTPHVVNGEPLNGVYRIDQLGYEIWQDSIDPFSSSAAVLGSLQMLGRFHGWLVVRDRNTGVFPALAGRELGATQWPTVDASSIGQAYATANGLQGGAAVITRGLGGDDFTICGTPPGNCNGGVAMTAFGGDLGAYFDAAVMPMIGTEMNSFVYLESAGFGINNSFDPIFGDTVGWDVVLVAASKCGLSPDRIPGDLNDDHRVDLLDYALFFDCTDASNESIAANCGPADTDDDGDVDLIDFGILQDQFGNTSHAPTCALDGN